MRSSRLRKMLVGFATVTLVAGAAVLYLVFYVNDRRETLIERNFRVLAQIAENIETKVESIPRISLNTFSKELEAQNKKVQQQQRQDREQQERLLAARRREAEKTRQQQEQEQMNQQARMSLKQSTYNTSKSAPVREVRAEPGPRAVPATTQREASFTKALAALHEDSVKVSIHSTGFLSRYRFKDDQEHPRSFQITENFEDFLRPLLRKDVFEHYVLTDSSGEVLYSTGHMGVLNFDIQHWQDSRDYQAGQEGSKTRNAWINTFTDMRIGGNEYKVFSHPFKLLRGEKLMLIGLVPDEDFEQNTVHVSTFKLILFTVIFVVLLLSYPFLKLVFISPTERLGIWDISNATMALFVATALSSVLILDVFRYNYYRDTTVRQGLQQVSNSIENSFDTELQSTIRKIKMYDSLQARLMGMNSREPVDITTNTAGDSLKISASTREAGKNALPEMQAMINAPPADSGSEMEGLRNLLHEDFLNIAWMNPQGQQVSKWTPEAANTRKISVADRSYFTEVRDHRMWSLQMADTSTNFFLSSIISHNTGDLLAAISVPSNIPGYPVVTLTRQLYSLHKPSLSMGYNYAVVDADGKVLFHSDGSLNLQENLLDELTEGEKLEALLLSRSSANFSSYYHGNEYLFHIEPLNKWPVYLITYFDESYLLAANSEILTFSLISLTAFALEVLLILAFLVYYDSSGSKLNYRLFRLNWLLPSHVNRQRYIVALWLNVALGAVFIAFTIWNYHHGGNVYLLVLFMLMLMPVLSLGGTYLTLVRSFHSPAKFWLWLGFFSFLLLGVTAIAWFQNVEMNIFLLYMAAGLVAILLAYLVSRRKFKQPWVKMSYHNAYRMMFLSLLLLWTQAMVFCSFKIAHDTEFLLYNRLVQLDLAEKFEKDFSSRSLPPMKISLNELPSYHLSHLVDACLMTDTILDRQLIGGNGNMQPEFMDLYLRIRPSYNSPTAQTLHLGDNSGLRGKWFWNKPGKYALEFYYQAGNNLLNVNSRIYPYQLPVLLDNQPLVFIVAVFLLLLVLYRILDFLYRRVVIANTVAMQKMVSLSSFIENEPGSGLVPDYLCYVGLPHSGKTGALDELRNSYPGQVEIFDLASLLHTPVSSLGLKQRTRLVILDHFEYGLHLPDLNATKLELVESLQQQGRLGIIIVSSVQPLDVILGNPDVFDKQRWIRALGIFKKTFYDLNTRIKRNKKLSLYELHDLEPGELLDRECDSLAFLRKLKPALQKKLSAPHARQLVSNDELLIKIQNLADFYYYSIWETCTGEEKYLLYDMAQDGMVNTRNIRVINSLLNKGLLHHDGVLKIINYSFRNFILTTVNPEEALKMERATRQDSTWKKMRMPIIMVLLLLAIFLFYTQREILDNFTALLTAVGGIVLALLRFSGSIGLKGKTTSENEK